MRLGSIRRGGLAVLQTFQDAIPDGSREITPGNESDRDSKTLGWIIFQVCNTDALKTSRARARSLAREIEIVSRLDDPELLSKPSDLLGLAMFVFRERPPIRYTSTDKCQGMKR